MNLFRTNLALCLSASILMSSSFATAAETVPASMSFTKKATIGVLCAMLFQFFATEPNNKDVRYDLEAAKAQFKAFMNGENRTENFKGLTNFAWYFLLDGIIGHASKRPSLRVDPATQKIDARPGAYSKGLFGMLHDYSKAPLGICYLLAALRVLIVDLPKAYDVASNLFDNPSNYVEAITAYGTDK
jgi:hypothetical protein